TTGGQIGETIIDGRPLRVRVLPQLPDVEARGATDQLRDMTVRSRPTAGGATGAPVALALLGRAGHVRRPAALRTEKGELCAYVYVDLEDGVDVQGYVQRARQVTDAT